MTNSKADAPTGNAHCRCLHWHNGHPEAQRWMSRCARVQPCASACAVTSAVALLPQSRSTPRKPRM